MKAFGSAGLWMLAIVLWGVVLASSAGAIYAKHRSRELFVELERHAPAA